MVGTVILVGGVYFITTVPPAVFNSLIMWEKWRQERIATTKARIDLHFKETESGTFVLELENRGIMISDFRPSVSAAKGNTLQLPASITEQPLDLLTVFTQPTQSYAIIGGQQTGKTFQARHIANYWLRTGIQPIVIGPKWDRGEWAECIKLGGNGDFGAVAKGINIVRQIVEHRHANSELSHKEHQILPVFFDDWTPIVEAVDNARSMVLDATTLYASVNVLLYFILHSDTANAWGVDKKGAALKDNFIKLFISPHYDANGLIVREKTQGYIRFSGESVDRPTRLFNTPISIIPMEQGEIELPEPELTEDDLIEAEVIAMFKEGTAPTQIAIEKFGHGGNQKKRVDNILSKHGLV